MFRSNASTEEYIRYMISGIDRFLFDDQDVMSYEIYEENFVIYCRGVQVLEEKLDFVERCRAIAVTKFENEIIQRLEEIGFKFKTDNWYYKAVVRK